jgi:hypothetical protein
VVGAVVDPENNLLEVTFDQAVTWDGVGAGTFTTAVGGGSWAEQLDAVTLRLAPDEGVVFEIDAAWEWTAADASLSPVPDPGQTGVCT